MPSYSFEGLRPVVEAGAYVHPAAVLIGDVLVGRGCYIGPNASLRGDYGRVVVGLGANIQDNCTVHSFPGRTVVVDEDGHVGHGAVLHGCTVGRHALIGMNAVIMDNVRIGADCIVGAFSFVKSGTCTEAGTLWAGSPAREIRQVSDDERAWKIKGTGIYQSLAHRCLKSLLPCEPLTQEEEERRRLSGKFMAIIYLANTIGMRHKAPIRS